MYLHFCPGSYDADASEAFYGRFMTDYLAASPNAAKTKGHVDFAEMTSPEVFVQGLKNLTEIQLKYIDKIIAKTSEPDSYADINPYSDIRWPNWYICKI